MMACFRIRCLWSALESQDFPVLDLSDRATTPPCGGEDGFRREKLQLGGSKEGGWVYTGPEPGAKMEFQSIRPSSAYVPLCSPVCSIRCAPTAPCKYGESETLREQRNCTAAPLGRRAFSIDRQRLHTCSGYDEWLRPMAAAGHYGQVGKPTLMVFRYGMHSAQIHDRRTRFSVARRISEDQ